jgi:hypothetical protein
MKQVHRRGTGRHHIDDSHLALKQFNGHVLYSVSEAQDSVPTSGEPHLNRNDKSLSISRSDARIKRSYQ